jgi:hypothetical protein
MSVVEMTENKMIRLTETEMIAKVVRLLDVFEEIVE